MNNTFVTKLDAVIDNNDMPIFARTLKMQWSNFQSGGINYASLITNATNGRIIIIPVSAGDIVTFTPTQTTDILYQPLTENPPSNGDTVVAVTPRETKSAQSSAYQYTVPSGANYLIIYMAYDITQAHTTYHFNVKVNNNNVRIPELSTW